MLRLAHTAELTERELRAARELLDAVFEGELDDDDWRHGLGGMHALVWEGAQLIGHASVVQRQLIHDGRTFRAGYVECVGVRPDRQRRGHGGEMMAALERVIRGAYELGALGATDQAAPLYRARGWLRWQGPTAALTPHGVVRTPHEDGAIYVLALQEPLDPTGELVCDWREGDLW